MSYPAPGQQPIYVTVLPAVLPKSRTVAAVVGFFLGGLGIHRFYLGNNGLGVLLLLVGPLTLCIWNLVDWIVVLAGGSHDGQRLPVVDGN